MTEVPRNVFRFLLGIHFEGYSRARVCAATGYSPRTVDRALGALVEMGWIARQRGGRGNSSKLTQLKDLASFPQLAHYVNKTGALNVKTGAPSEFSTGALNLKVITREERKPPLSETRAKRERPIGYGWMTEEEYQADRRDREILSRRA